MSLLQETKKASKGYSRKRASAIYIHAGIWLNSSTKDIHMTVPTEQGFHTTVSNKPYSKRYHPNLYKKLESLLKKHGVMGTDS